MCVRSSQHEISHTHNQHTPERFNVYPVINDSFVTITNHDVSSCLCNPCVSVRSNLSDSTCSSLDSSSFIGGVTHSDDDTYNSSVSNANRRHTTNQRQATNQGHTQQPTHAKQPFGVSNAADQDRGELPVIPVRFNGHLDKALVDTGSAFTILTKNYRHLVDNRSWCCPNFHAANGSPIKVYRKVTVNATIAHHTVPF